MQASATDDLITTPSVDDNQKNFSVSTTDSPVRITQEHICENNPNVDYTRYFDSEVFLQSTDIHLRPDLISLVFSDVGSLTPEGVSQYLVGMFAG